MIRVICGSISMTGMATVELIWPATTAYGSPTARRRSPTSIGRASSCRRTTARRSVQDRTDSIPTKISTDCREHTRSLRRATTTEAADCGSGIGSHERSSGFVPITVRERSANSDAVHGSASDHRSSIRIELPNGVLIHWAGDLDGQRLSRESAALLAFLCLS